MHDIQSKERKSIFGRCNCGGRRSANRSDCNSIVIDAPLKTPELAIYSQQEEVNNGRVPNWNSPDITTVYWKPFRLMPEATFVVKNRSDVPAIRVLLHYFISRFGIGTTRELKLSKIVNIPSASQVELKFPLEQFGFGGDSRIGVHLQIEHPFDRNLVNNFGSQALDVSFTSEFGKDFNLQFPVLNDSNFSSEIRLSIMPTDLTATVTPASHLFAPNEQINANLRIQIPLHLNGTPEANVIREVTVVGRLPTNQLVGGVTSRVFIDD